MSYLRGVEHLCEPLPEPCEPHCGIALRNPEHLADLARGESLQIQQSELPFQNVQPPDRIQQFSAPVILFQPRVRSLVDWNLLVSLPLPANRISERHVVGDPIEPCPLARITPEMRARGP